METDKYSEWLGIQLEHIAKGECQLKMEVREEMLNGFSISHGGITYALADSTLAFASNSHGSKAVSIETSINHLLPVKKGDILLSTAQQLSRTKSLAIYTVNVTNQDQELVAFFKGIVKISREEWAV